MCTSNSARRCRPIVPRAGFIFCVAALALCHGCAKTPEPGAANAVARVNAVADASAVEKDALAALEAGYQLSYHEKDPEGRIIDMRLEGRQFDDASVAQARQCKSLIGISLNGSSITDDGVEMLQDLRLKRIAFVRTPITDRGLSYLENIPTLRDIWLLETPQLTTTGIECLRKAIPGVRVHVMNRPAPQKKLENKEKEKGNPQ